MDDLSTWRDPNECVVSLLAGVNFLYELLQERHAKSNLVRYILDRVFPAKVRELS